MKPRTMTSLLPAQFGVGLVLLTAMTACAPTTSSSSHWLVCQTVSDCTAPGATACTDGYCTDAQGNRISSETAPTAGGGSSSAKTTPSPTAGGSTSTSAVVSAGGASPSAGGAPLAGGGASSSTGGTYADVCVGAAADCFPLCEGGLCDCYCPPATGGTGGGAGAAGSKGGGNGTGVCASHPAECVPMCQGGICECFCPASGGTAGTSGAGGSTSTSASSAGAAGVCSGFDSAFIDSVKGCAADSDCMKVGYQTNCCGGYDWIGIRADRLTEWGLCISTRPPFPACGCASMGDTAEDGLFVARNDGSEVGVSCIANKCTSHIVARSCGLTNPVICSDGQICVAYESVIGPTSSVDYACVANPCSDKLDCTCGAAACDLRTDSTRICSTPAGAGRTSIIDIECQDTRQ